MRRDFLEKTLGELEEALERAGRAEGSGPLRTLDPRVKLAGFLGLIIAAASSHRLPVTLSMLAFAMLLVAISGRAVWRACLRLWAGAAFFTGLVVLPALFLTPGEPLVAGITGAGLRSAASVLARVETTATLASLLALTTPWPALLRALRFFRVPALGVMIFAMATRFIFVLLGIARDAFEARRARRVGHLPGPVQRQMAVSGAAMLLGKSIHLGGEVYEAMLARGFRGEAVTLDQFRLTARDGTAAALFAALTIAALKWGCWA